MRIHPVFPMHRRTNIFFQVIIGFLSFVVTGFLPSSEVDLFGDTKGVFSPKARNSSIRDLTSVRPIVIFVEYGLSVCD